MQFLSIHIKYGCMMLIHVTVVDAVDGKYSENWVNDPFSKKKYTCTCKYIKVILILI